MTCEQTVVDKLAALEFSQEELQNPDLLAYIKFACLHGASPNWIADHIRRLKNLKALLQGLKSKHPELSDDDLEELSKKYMNGASSKEISAAAKDLANKKAIKNSGPKT